MADVDVEDDGSEESFKDAHETRQIAEEMDLQLAIEETTMALNLFLNNKFSEAKSVMEPCFLRRVVQSLTEDKNAAARRRAAKSSMYHALGYGTIMYLQAVMTFDLKDIENAIEAAKSSVTVCEKRRRRVGMVDSIAKVAFNKNISTIYDDYTDEEIHAELCYAECLLEKSLLTFVQDENLISFVKGGLKIRQCYQSYKECNRILQHRTWKDPRMKAHFESGVRMGVGAFNLMISLLPSKVLKLLEFVGFSGNKFLETGDIRKRFGLSELEKAANLEHSLRGPLCSMILISYHTVITYVLGTADGDIDAAERELDKCLISYPKGAMFLFFAGRIEETRGNLDKAISRFDESINSQSEWKQFHHLCYWELMWCNAFKGDWLVAMKYAETLNRESRWSRATYTYQKASFLLMCDQRELSQQTRDHVNFLFGEVPKLKQRIAGKSVPIEKFAVKKAKRYFSQGNRLTLPALELIYVWNGFSIIGKKPELLRPMQDIVEKTISIIEQNKETYQFYEDDYCLAMLLKGVCLKSQGRFLQAEMCFREIATLEKKLKEDTYLVPWSQAELAFMMLADNQLDEAQKLLDHVRTDFKGYLLESRLHFRMHSANLRIKAIKRGEIDPVSFADQNLDFSPNYNDVDDDSPDLKAKNGESSPRSPLTPGSPSSPSSALAPFGGQTPSASPSSERPTPSVSRSASFVSKETSL